MILYSFIPNDGIKLRNGSYRNHCPFCLYSKHVDVLPGDRKNKCGGLMRPVSLMHKSGKGFQIIHRCVICGAEKANRIAENTIQSDNIDKIINLIIQPFVGTKIK